MQTKIILLYGIIGCIVLVCTALIASFLGFIGGLLLPLGFIIPMILALRHLNKIGINFTFKEYFNTSYLIYLFIAMCSLIPGIISLVSGLISGNINTNPSDLLPIIAIHFTAGSIISLIITYFSKFCYYKTPKTIQ